MELSKKDKNIIKRLNKKISGDLIEIRAIVKSLEISEEINYPANVLVSIVEKKIKNIFNMVEKNRRILKIF